MELRPVERRITKLIQAGQDREVIADRFLRSTAWVNLVARMAAYKETQHKRT